MDCNSRTATSIKHSSVSASLGSERMTTEAAHYELVTRAQRKSMQRKRAQQVKDASAKRQKIRQEADQEVAEALRGQSEDFVEVEVNWDDIPFQIHPTHVELVFVGGYVGCVRCGLYASTNKADNALKVDCRKQCPAGSRGAVRRMLRGRHPQGSAGQKWPNGQDNPAPHKLLVNKQVD